MDNKEYSNGEITVVWKADKCIHSGNCVRGLPQTFKPKERPWIQLETVTTEQLKNTIDKCPSGALSYYDNSKENTAVAPASKIELINNGPLIVHGGFTLSESGEEKAVESPRTAFCRCGASSKLPYCDGTHKNKA